MTLDNLKLALELNNEELIKRLSHENHDVLEKFSVDKDGNVLYNGEKIISDIKISGAEGNGIEQKEDGIYVPSESEAVKELKRQINIFSEYQKYLNTELEYATYVLKPDVSESSRGLSVKNSMYLPFSLLEGNMDKANNGLIKLKGGKRYVITYGASITDIADTYAVLQLKDQTNNIALQHMYLFPQSMTSFTRSNEGSKSRTYAPKQDCYIGLYYHDESSVNTHNNGIVITCNSQKTFIVVHEVGRDIVIDPVEYVDDQQGLEDCPVGHILSFMGNTPPKHYLKCDGSEYDILEYPELANHIRKEFGKYNYFGGDGIDTFAVPDLRGEFLRGTGTAARKTGSGAAVGKHQNGTQHPGIRLHGNGSGIFAGYGNANDTTKFPYIDNVDSSVNGDTAQSRNAVQGGNLNLAYYPGAYPINYTSRPTNTSVMYCIKYEKTFYMHVDNPLVGRQEEILWEGSTNTANGDIELLHSYKDYDFIGLVFNDYYHEIPVKELITRECIRIITFIWYSDIYSAVIYAVNESDTIVNVHLSNMTLEKITGIKYQKVTSSDDDLYTDEQIQQAVLETVDLLKGDDKYGTDT